MSAFKAALDSCVPNAAEEALNLFRQRRDDIRFNTYVTSMSEHDSSEDFLGRISMWRAFGNNPVRVAIVFKVPKISTGSLALRLLFSPAAYLTAREIYDVINEVNQNIRTSGAFLSGTDYQKVVQMAFYMLLASATCLKHEGFEGGARVEGNLPSHSLSVPTDGIGDGGHRGNPTNRLQNTSRSISFGCHRRPRLLAIFHRLIIGPSPYPWVMFEAFRSALANSGVNDSSSRILGSSIPIRA